MRLSVLDWGVIAAYFGFNLLIGLWYRGRAIRSTEEYFVGGRNVSWWLAGTSMVATTFAADTPLAVTGLVAMYGIAGNWLWWNMLLSSMLTVFFFARLWRRSGVVTDVEFAELRYGGAPAAFLRGFRALYLGLPINCIILGWVNLAMVKILMMIFPFSDVTVLGTVLTPKMQALSVVLAMMLLTAAISTLSGLWGVLVTDLFQFVLKLGMVLLLAWFAVRACGGMERMTAALESLSAAKGQGSFLAFTPDIGSAWMPVVSFLTFVFVTWWATWYPGAEPGGGGYIAQRMFCAKDEKHSLLATLWFTVAHYAVRPWPWILTALASLVLYPELADKESGFIMTIVDPAVFPSGLRGVMIAAFAAAYMSTISTQLNWGASYIVNDFYRRFLVKGREERHYVRSAQFATLFLMLFSCVVTYYQNSVSGAWKFLLAVGAGTGSVFILRWFWWRINAWSEISAMTASFLFSMLAMFALKLDQDDPRQFAYSVLLTVAASTASWLAVTFLTAPEERGKLLSFYRKVRPAAALWGPVAREASDVVPSGGGRDDFFNFAAGCVLVYAVLFGTGNVLFGRYLSGAGLLCAAVGAGVFIFRNLSRRGWKVAE